MRFVSIYFSELLRSIFNTKHFYTFISLLTMGIAEPPQFLGAEPNEFGLFVLGNPPALCFMPKDMTELGTALPPRISDAGFLTEWSSTWRVPLCTVSAQPEDPAFVPIFEAQWTDEHYRNHSASRNDVVQAFEGDFFQHPSSEGNPLEDAMRCGRGPQTPHSLHAIQIVLDHEDEVRLDLRSLPLPPGRSFALKVYGAALSHFWDDAPGVHRRVLPNGWVLRTTDSAPELNLVQLNPESRVFALAIQGPGIGGDPAQNGSIICLYYVPKSEQSIPRSLRRRRLLAEVLPGKLQFLKSLLISRSGALPLLEAALKVLTPWEPTRVLRASNRDKRFFSTAELRMSHLYGGHIFQEAVYAHAYTHFIAQPSLLLANLVWDEKTKGEELKKYCHSRFNTYALPAELQDFLFQKNPPFAKLRFQVNVQTYMPGNQKIHCLRPHYAVANMPFESGKADLVNGRFAMRLYGAAFTNPNSEGDSSPHCPFSIPSGFSLKNVHTHEGNIYGENSPQKQPGWIASPENCQIAGTDNPSVSRSFYSVVLGTCMRYANAYADDRNSYWQQPLEVVALATLHILLSSTGNPADSQIPDQCTYATQTLSEAAQTCYYAWEEKHRQDDPTKKTKNPFTELRVLMSDEEAGDVF